MRPDCCDHDSIYHGTPMLLQREARTGRSYLLVSEHLNAKLRVVDVTANTEADAKVTTVATLYGPTALAAADEHKAYAIDENFVFNEINMELSIPCSNLEVMTAR